MRREFLVKSEVPGFGEESVMWIRDDTAEDIAALLAFLRSERTGIFRLIGIDPGNDPMSACLRLADRYRELQAENAALRLELDELAGRRSV